MQAVVDVPKAGMFMQKHIVTVTPEMTPGEVTIHLLEKGVSNAPVVRHEEHGDLLLGFISEKDCLEYLSNECYYRTPGRTVESVMKRHPVCVSPDDDLFTLASIFIHHGFRHLPVVQDQVLVGMVSRRDVLWALCDYHKEMNHQEEERRFPPDLRKIVNHRFIVR